MRPIFRQILRFTNFKPAPPLPRLAGSRTASPDDSANVAVYDPRSFLLISTQDVVSTATRRCVSTECLLCATQPLTERMRVALSTAQILCVEIVKSTSKCDFEDGVRAQQCEEILHMIAVPLVGASGVSLLMWFERHEYYWSNHQASAYRKALQHATRTSQRSMAFAATVDCVR